MASIKKFHVASCRGGGCECLWCVDYRPLGLHGPRRRVRFRTRKEAERFASATAHQAARGEYVAPAQIPRFGELAEDFSSKADRRAGHRANLRASLDQHLLPAFGRTRLDQIRVESIERFRDQLRAEGYAPVTINAFLQDLGAVFKLAVRRGVCLVNPVERLERAFVGAREIELRRDNGERPEEGRVTAAELLTPAELRRLVAAAAPGMYRMLLALAAASGLRSGELLALQWSDLQLPPAGAGRAQVRRTLSPITEVQHLLGHSSPAVTLKVYAHFLPSDQSLGTEALTQAILGLVRDGQGGAAVEKWALSGHSGAESDAPNGVSA